MKPSHRVRPRVVHDPWRTNERVECSNGQHGGCWQGTSNVDSGPTHDKTNQGCSYYSYLLRRIRIVDAEATDDKRDLRVREKITQTIVLAGLGVHPAEPDTIGKAQALSTNTTVCARGCTLPCPYMESNTTHTPEVRITRTSTAWDSGPQPQSKQQKHKERLRRSDILRKTEERGGISAQRAYDERLDR